MPTAPASGGGDRQGPKRRLGVCVTTSTDADQGLQGLGSTETLSDAQVMIMVGAEQVKPPRTGQAQVMNDMLCPCQWRLGCVSPCSLCDST